MNTIIIIGGGAAGFFSAIHNKKNNPRSKVIIIEKSPEVLSKVKISGGGRCNLTNACFDPKALTENYPRGAKELQGPMRTFGPKETIDWFESHGVPLKTEPDNRVFPVSNNSQSIIDCLSQTAQNLGIKLWTDCKVTKIAKSDQNFTLTLENKQTHTCQKLILATGSSRAGYEFAKALGHTIIPPIPSLFTFKINDSALHALSGLSVPKAQAWISGKKKQAQSGPILITHWGLSGPCIIKLSAWHARELHDQNYKTTLHINWLPEYSTDQLQKALQAIPQKSPFPELPNRLWHYLLTKINITPTPPGNTPSKKHQNKLIQELQESHHRLTGQSKFKEEFVTCGGVPLKEINFKTMESKPCSNLHIIGELLNIDGITGGFNFQNAWTTAILSSKIEIQTRIIQKP